MGWKRNKRRKRGFKISFPKLVLPALFFLIILSAILIIRSNIFIIHFVDVQAEKADCVNADQIKDSSKLPGQNFFIINFSKVENDLKKKFLCIKSVKTSRYFPNKVILQVFGREPAAILVIQKEATEAGLIEKFSEEEATSSGEASSSAVTNLFMDPPLADDMVTESFVVDSEGVIYSQNIEQINAPRVYVSGLNLTLGQKVKEYLIINTLKILEKIKTFRMDVKEAKIYSERFLLINAMPRLIFRLDEKVDIQTASLQLILNKAKIDSKELEFIDLRFDKPIIRFAPKKK